MRKIKRTVIDLVPVWLYLVTFTPIYGNRCTEGEHDDCLDYGCFDNGQEYIAEIEPELVRVTTKNYRKLSVDVTNKDHTWNAKELFEDTHDLRPRLFKTKAAAEHHLEFTLNRFNKPQPWEVFVKFE